MATETTADRITAARRELAARRAADPEAVQRYETRMARLAAAAKRERERFETRVLGQYPAPVLPRRPAGMSKAEWKVLKVRLREEAIAGQSLAAKWSHKQGTPETMEAFDRTSHHRFPLLRMAERGMISSDQRAWGEEIAMVAEGIEAAVEVRSASYEARVDNQSGDRDRVIEGLIRVRRHVAYTAWRKQLPTPKRLVLDMIVGEGMTYNAAARLHHVGWRRAKRLLIEALDRWPKCVEAAARGVSKADVDAVNADLYSR